MIPEEPHNVQLIDAARDLHAVYCTALNLNVAWEHLPTEEQSAWRDVWTFAENLPEPKSVYCGCGDALKCPICDYDDLPEWDPVPPAAVWIARES